MHAVKGRGLYIEVICMECQGGDYTGRGLYTEVICMEYFLSGLKHLL